MSPELVAAILDGKHSTQFLERNGIVTALIKPTTENARLARAVSLLLQRPTARTPAIPLQSMQLLPMF
ncbi:hypothetical protein LPN04_31580 [Rugamonas sp. A1-17]|nr:hypothetical protein [Rugamonas sp. A1-17]